MKDLYRAPADNDCNSFGSVSGPFSLENCHMLMCSGVLTLLLMEIEHVQLYKGNSTLSCYWTLVRRCFESSRGDVGSKLYCDAGKSAQVSMGALLLMKHLVAKDLTNLNFMQSASCSL